MIICGIDPGKKGGIAQIDQEGTVFHIAPMPNIHDLMKFLRDHGKIKVYLEKAQSMPSDGSKGAFTYADSYGQIQGIMIALMIPYELIAPQIWTRTMHVGCTGTNPKAKSLQAARRLFPTADLLATPRCRVPHDGMVDALLIAEYGRRHYGK